MFSLKAGVTSTFIILIVFVIGMYIYMKISKKGMYFRRIPGLDALEECVGRAVEMGRPVQYSPGQKGVTDTNAPPTLAAITMLSYVAQICARKGANIGVSIMDAQVMPLVDQSLKEAYLAEGIDQYPKDGIQWLAPTQFSFAAAMLARLRREKPAAIFYIGHCEAETLMIAETGIEIGAMQVMGTEAVAQLPFMTAAADYTIYGDEIYAADAYLSRNVKTMGSLRTIDLGKLFAMLVIIIGSILSTFGISILTQILKW